VLTFRAALNAVQIPALVAPWRRRAVPVTLPKPLVRQLTGVPFAEDALPTLDTTIPRWPCRPVDLGGLTVNVRETPGPRHAPVAVYVHGLGGSATNWTDMAAQLSGSVRGYAVDLPGFGQSAPPTDYDYRIESHVDVVIRLIETLGHGPVHLFGNSMGGAISILVAAARPDLVRTLTLISPAVPDLRPDVRRVSDPRMALAFLPLIGPRMRRELAGLTPRERTEQMMKLCFAEPELVSQTRFDGAMREYEQWRSTPWGARALGRTTVGLLRAWIAPAARSIWTVLPRVAVPTLVVWGDEDKLISVRKAPRTVRLLPRARLLVLSKTGHVAQMERPATVARAFLGMRQLAESHAW
jgi:pimeloyl-ACP methyl ester carboxylesterase